MEAKPQPADEGYWNELRRIAIDLRGNGRGWRSGFWKSFGGKQGIAALMGWLHYRGKCVYCATPVDLVQRNQMIGGAATTDHLIPRAKSAIQFKSHFNAVPVCACCNSIKGLLDRELRTSDYPEMLDQKEREKLILQAKRFIDERRAVTEALFPKDKADWDRALERRNALGEPPS